VTSNPKEIGRHVVHLRKSAFLKISSKLLNPYLLVQKDIFNPKEFTFMDKTNFNLQKFEVQVGKSLLNDEKR